MNQWACVFSREIWFLVLRVAGLAQLSPPPDATLVDWWLRARTQVPHHCRRGFDSVTLSVTWELWKERSRRTFQTEPMSPPVLFQRIIDEANALMGAGFGAMSVFLALGT